MKWTFHRRNVLFAATFGFTTVAAAALVLFLRADESPLSPEEQALVGRWFGRAGSEYVLPHIWLVERRADRTQSGWSRAKVGTAMVVLALTVDSRDDDGKGLLVGTMGADFGA